MVMVPLDPVMVPVIPLVLLSVTFTIWNPAVVKVAVKVPTPPVKELAAGTEVETPESVLVNVTVPA